MPKITFIEPDGTSKTVEAQAGRSVMEAACANLIRGILADCGGSCSCATCHVYVDEAWTARLQPASQDEAVMLEGALDVLPGSRLSCQIPVTDALDGLLVRLPKSQI